MSSSSTASKLDKLIGLDQAKHLLRRLASGEAGSHAVLFYGVSGSGKEELASLLAQAWLCRSPGPDGADGVCQACASFDRGTNPDVLRIEPVKSSSLIVVKQIVNQAPKEEDPQPMTELFRTSPLMSRHKVAIVTDAHRMNDAASNALLKTLEEPFPHAKIVLTTDTVGGVRPTILSRCLAVACALPNRAQLADSFPGATEDDVRLAEYAPGRLRAILEHRSTYEAVADFGRALPSRPPGEALLVADEFKAITEAIDTAKKTGARAAQAEALSLLANFLAGEPGVPPSWVQQVIKSHQRILGNAGAAIVFDALFAGMLTEGS